MGCLMVRSLSFKILSKSRSWIYCTGHALSVVVVKLRTLQRLFGHLPKLLVVQYVMAVPRYIGVFIRSNVSGMLKTLTVKASSEGQILSVVVSLLKSGFLSPLSITCSSFSDRLLLFVILRMTSLFSLMNAPCLLMTKSCNLGGEC